MFEIMLSLLSQEEIVNNNEIIQKEEEKYTDDVLGCAKKLIFSDLSLASWSNKDISVSMHSNIIDYQTNQKENIHPNSSFEGIEMTPQKMKFDEEVFHTKIDEDEFSKELSQNSIIFSPMNLKHYQLPLDEVDEFKKSKIYDSKYINFDWFENREEKQNKPISKDKNLIKEVSKKSKYEIQTNNKPFEYIETNNTDLKASDDSTAYAKYFTKCASMK